MSEAQLFKRKNCNRSASKGEEKVSLQSDLNKVSNILHNSSLPATLPGLNSENFLIYFGEKSN